MITKEEKEKLETKIKSLEAQIKQQTNSTESENSNKNLLGIAKKLNIDEIEVDKDTSVEETQKIVTREINELQKKEKENWELSANITNLNAKISQLERELERKNKENERLTRISTDLEKSLKSLQKKVEERDEIEEKRIETAKLQGELEAQGKCLDNGHINPNDEKNENKIKSIAKTKYGMKTKETYNKLVKEKNGLKKELDDLKKRLTDTSNTSDNSQEQSNQQLLEIARALGIQPIEVDEGSSTETIKKAINNKAIRLQEKNNELLQKSIKSGTAITSLETDLEEKKKEIEGLNKEVSRHQKNHETIKESYEKLLKIVKQREAIAKQEGKNEVTKKCQADKHINPENPMNQAIITETAKSKYGMKTPEEFAQIANELQQLKDNNTSANSQEQISELNSETKPITGEEINIALVFLTVVSWIGLLGVLIRDRKRENKKSGKFWKK